ncbi:MAG: hypothetical protein JW852_06440 [Spirochaetales bacterium]|nr:hypothetical protein [Spirochaetales bacterium]
MKTYSRSKALVVWLSLGFIVIALPASAVIIGESDENRDGKTDQWIEDLGNEKFRVTRDRDFDGRVDYALVFDSGGAKEYEEQDFNYDGEMDDFYFYRAGVLELRKVDTNFDGTVDLWVHLDQGVYVWKIERDTDFDGSIDYMKEYGPPPARQ